MKKNIIVLVLALIMMPMLAGAQALKGSYFLENSLNGHQMNPAFAPRANYFQLLPIANMGVGTYTNLDMKTFLYPVSSGKLGTFLHPEVSVQQFDRALPNYPHLDADVNANIFSFGFYNKKKAFWNFEIDARVNVDVDLPRDLFFFLKKGTGLEGDSFNVGNINAYAMAGVQASLGYSREFVKGLRTGIKVRAIAPVAYGALNLENVRLNTTQEQWTVETEGYLHAVMQGLDISMPGPDAQLPDVSFDLNKLLANKVLAGIGYSVDLGVRYTLEVGSVFDGLTLSASVTDLGQIFYKSEAITSFESHGQMAWNGVNLENTIDIENPLDILKEDAMALLNLTEIKNTGEDMVRSTMPTVYAGVELPFLRRKMSVGLLYSARVSHSYVREELTASYNLKPAKWIALGVNYSFLNTGGTVGGIFEFTPKAGPTFYLGCDYFPYQFAPFPFDGVDLGNLQFGSLPVPMSWRFNLNYGIAFNLGSKHVNPKKNKR